MKKTLRFSLVGLLLAFCFSGGVKAQKVTLNFTENNWALPESAANKATESKEFTNGTYSITLQAADGYYFNTDGYLMLGKKGSTLILPKFDFKVAFIEVIGRTGASTSTLQNIYVGETAVSTQTKGAAGTSSFEIADDYQAVGTIYTLKVESAHNTQITEIKIYESGDEPEIVDISNTPETAYSVEKANELITAGEGLATKVYVKGFITAITEVSTDFGNATYTISDTKDANNSLLVFRGYSLNGEKFTTGDEIEVGDEVVVYGQLMNYNGTYEIGTGNSIYSLNGITTGINNVTTDVLNENAPIYNLAGQRVSKDTKGILIQNGKKFVNNK